MIANRYLHDIKSCVSAHYWDVFVIEPVRSQCEFFESLTFVKHDDLVDSLELLRAFVNMMRAYRFRLLLYTRTNVNKLSVTPIGTCRINNPLKQAQSKYPISLNTKRVYGFTHTSDEALQQLRYLQGDKVFRERGQADRFSAGGRPQ